MRFRYALFLSPLLVACGTVAAIKSTLDEAKKIGQNINSTITAVKMSATMPATMPVRGTTKAPPLPAKATGGQDLMAPRPSATYGQENYDIDEDGAEELLDVIVDEPAQVVFIGWVGDEASEDVGECYLAWEAPQSSYFVQFSCEDPSADVFVCDLSGDVTCAVCNSNGDCNACPEDAEVCEAPPLDGNGGDCAAKATAQCELLNGCFEAVDCAADAQTRCQNPGGVDACASALNGVSSCEALQEFPAACE